MADNIKTLKVKLYNNESYVKKFDSQAEILRKVWNLLVALHEYVNFESKVKYAKEKGNVYTSPKRLEYYLEIWERFFKKYPEEYDKLFFEINEGENKGQLMPCLNTKTNCKYTLTVLLNIFKKDKEFVTYVPKNSKIISSVSIEKLIHRYGDSLLRHNKNNGKTKTSDKNNDKTKTSAPKFKKYGEYNTIEYRDIVVDSNVNIIDLNVFGKVKFFNKQYIKDTFDEYLKDTHIYKSNKVSVTKESDGLYMQILFKYNSDAIKINGFEKGKSVGIDLGIKRLATLSDGTYYENKKFLEKSYRELRVLQRKLSRKISYDIAEEVDTNGEIVSKKKFSKNQTSAYRNVKKQIAKLHTKIRRQRKNEFNEIISEISPKYEIIVLEKLNVKGMSAKAKPKQDEDGNFIKNGQSQKRGLNKSLSDTALSLFVMMLEAKVGEARIVFVDPKYTSQTCNKCGHTEAENRKTQEKFKCTSCNHEDNADDNASKNIELIWLDGKNNIKEVFNT